MATEPARVTRTGREWAVLAVRLVIVVGIAVGIVYATVVNWDEVRAAIAQIAPLSLALSFGALILGLFSGVRIWHVVLGSMGSPLPYRQAAQINLLGLLGKYLPGSIWAYVLQTELSRRAGVPRARAFVALLVATGVSTATAFGLAPIARPLVQQPQARLALTLAPLALVTLYPPVLGWIVRTALAVLRRPQPDLRFSGEMVVRATGWALLTWLLFGAHLWFLANALVEPGFGGYLRITAAMALAMTLGFLAFLAPSGLGVREAFIVAALTPALTPGAALGIALVSRFLFTVADLTAAGLAVLLARRQLARADESEPQAPPGL